MAVPLKYLSNFGKSLEMPLINCKIHLELNWSKDCVRSAIDDTTFKKTNTKLYVPIVTLSSKDDVKLAKLFEKRFKRSVSWNEYQAKIESISLDLNNLKDFLFMLYFKELDDCLFLLFTIKMVEIRKLKETV